VKIRKVVLLGSLVAACLLLLTLQTRGYGSMARDFFAVVTTPIQTGLAKASRATFGLWSTYLDWKNVRAENRRLREEVQELRVRALRVSETDDENRRLRRLLALQENLHVENGGVVEADIETQTITISGQVTGNVAAKQKVEIRADGKMVGDIKAPRITIADGATFKGNVDMDV